MSFIIDTLIQNDGESNPDFNTRIQTYINDQAYYYNASGGPWPIPPSDPGRGAYLGFPPATPTADDMIWNPLYNGGLGQDQRSVTFAYDNTYYFKFLGISPPLPPAPPFPTSGNVAIWTTTGTIADGVLNINTAIPQFTNLVPATINGQAVEYSQFAALVAGTVLSVNDVFPVAGNVSLTTANIPQGATNKYSTNALTLGYVLTGLAAGVNAPITAANTIKTAFQDLQAQISAIVGGDVSTVNGVAPTVGNIQLLVSDTGTAGALQWSGLTLQIPEAAAAKTGLLKSADFVIFNAKQPAGSYITALTGEVTAAGPGSVAATIANAAVTFAKFQNLSGPGILTGRYSAGAGDMQEITLGTGMAMSGAGVLSSTGLGGTVTSVSVVSANGFAGTVATATTTPAITLTTTITGVLKGNGTAISAATDADITGKLLTGYVSGAGVVAAADSILQAIQKLNGNIGALITGVSSVTGTANRITTAPTTGAVIVDISAAYVGQASITTVGTLTGGTMGAGFTIALGASTITGTLPIVNGGRNNTTAATNGVDYYDGTKFTTLSTFVFDGTKLGIGAVADSILTVSRQTTIIGPPANTAAHFIGLDANPLRVVLDTHDNANAGGSAFIGRRSRGTAGTPLAVNSGDTIITFNATGYGATGYAAASTGLITIKANQTFTDTAMGTYITFFTTPDGSVTAAEALRVTGAGIINAALVAGKYQINGTDVLTATTLGSTVVNSSLTLVGTLVSLAVTGAITGASYTANGTGGAGFVELQTQPSQPASGAANSVRLYSNGGSLAWKKASDGFERKFSSVYTADRTITWADVSGTVAFGTGAANTLPYWSTTNGLTNDANTLINGTSYLFGYSTLANAELAGFQKNQNSATYLSISNTTSGTAGRVFLAISNESTTTTTGLYLQTTSALYTTSGIVAQDTAVISSNKANGFNLGTINAKQVAIFTNNTEKVRINSSGEVGIGMTAVNILDITQTQNAQSLIKLLNSNASTASSTSFQLSNGTSLAFLNHYGTGFTTAGLLMANRGIVGANGANGLVVAANNAAGVIYYAVGGTAVTNEVARMDTTGVSFQNLLTSLTFSAANKMCNFTTLVAGVKTVTITGLTTNHLAFCTIKLAGGTIGEVQAVCTANTLTLTSIVAGGIATQILDTSTINYVIFLTN